MPRRLPPWLGLGLVVACACAIAASPRALSSSPAADVKLVRGCVEKYDASIDYFPDKVTVDDATNFGVTYHRHYKVVQVRQAYAGGPAERYVLVQCGTPAPRLEGDLAGAQIATVPVTSLFTASSTHMALLVDLGRLDVLTGVPRLRELIGDAVTARAATGAVREFAPLSVIDAELVVSSRPGLFMSGGASSPSLPVIRSAGVPVVANTEWLEPTALARAEWLKYLALFLNEERTAQQVYDAMKARYQALSARATARPEASRPLVMTGRSNRGSFVIAGGRSYVAALIRDAGGRYVWADNTSTGAPTVDLEAQVARAAQADIWINGGGWASLAAMAADEPRYAAFKAYRTGQVWVYERRMTPTGGNAVRASPRARGEGCTGCGADGAANDYWSRSVSHPDLVLADLVKIFHPSLMSTHAFEWYMPVPAR